MAKKKDKPQVINNIQELNLEIDYDKLADAMVKAQEKTITDANQSKKFTSGMFSMSAFVILRLAASLGAIISLIIALSCFEMFKAFAWSNFGLVIKNIIQIITQISLVLLSAFYSILLWKSAKEIETEKDLNYIIAVFSGIVSFAALIVALIALFDKGVG